MMKKLKNEIFKGLLYLLRFLKLKSAISNKFIKDAVSILSVSTDNVPCID